MERQWEWFILLLCIGRTLCQESGDPTLEPPEDNPVDEEWEYVEFLKEISTVVEDILQFTLVSAKDQRGFAGLDQTVAETLEQVMSIRESLLAEIKRLRKSDTKPSNPRIQAEEMLSEFRMKIMTILLKLVDQDAATVEKLKDISKELLSFKQKLSNEIMRILMLPPDVLPPPPVDVECDCDSINQTKTDLEEIFKCASGKAEDPDACLEPPMYFMGLISITDFIDAEIRTLYSNIIATTDDGQRQKFRGQLDTLKLIRDGGNGKDGIDELISKLIEKAEEDEETLKKLVTRSLRGVVSDLERQVADCSKKCEICQDSCVKPYLEEIIAKMISFEEEFNRTQDATQEDEERVRDFVRTELIKYINTNNDIVLRVLTEKAKKETVDQCEETWSEYFKTTLKVPMWMLVNTTIFAEFYELEVMIGQSITLLEQRLDQESGCEVPPSTTTKPELINCDWKEYEQTKKYLERVDLIIQESLFKDSTSGRMDALLGFVDIQSLLDNRVKELYEDETVKSCPNEVTFIKQQYMVQLNQCMTDFMALSEEDFGYLSRLGRISCTKQLRTMMGQRMGILLSSEVNRSLTDITTSSPRV